MFMFLSIVTLLIRPSLGATTSLLTKLTALKFGNDRSSYIKFTPDWSPFSNRVSACAWIRDLGSSTHRTVFQASSNELLMTANGGYISMLGTQQHLQSKISVAKGTWFHECVTWSTSSGTHRVYINGKEIGAKSTPDRLMKATGALTLGNYGGNNNAWIFGGEMVYLNFYAKELSASEVASMSQRGMCSHIADVDEHESSRVIKWEDLVKIGRSGTVTDIDITDCRYLKEILEESDQRFNETVQLENELEDVSTRLNSTLAELEETQADKVENKQKLEDVSTRLNSTLAELEEISANLKLSKTWDWDIFLSEQFLNQTFTSENSQLLRSAWDDIAEALVGIRITDKFIKLLSQVDRVEDRPWSMLYSENYLNAIFTQEMADRLTSIWDEISEKMVGLTMTKGVIELLKYVTDKGNCEPESS